MMEDLNLSLAIYIVVLSVLATFAIYYSRRRFLLGKSLKKPLDMEAEAQELFGEVMPESDREVITGISRIVESIERLEKLVKDIMQRNLNQEELNLLRKLLEEVQLSLKDDLRGTSAFIITKMKREHDELKNQQDKIMESLERQIEIFDEKIKMTTGEEEWQPS
jgi:ABC-type phosphate transport system auxiliary subunit